MESAVCLYGRAISSMVGIMMSSSCRTYVSKLCLPGMLLPVPQLHGRPLSTQASARDSHSRASLAQALVGSLLFLCVLVHTRFCLYPSRVFVSLVLCNFSKQILVIFKVRLPGVSQSLWQIPSLESLLWGPESLEQCEKFFRIIVLQFVDHPPSGFMVGLMVTSSKRAYVNMLCLPGWLQPVPQLLGRLLLTHKSAGDLHSLTGRSISVSSGGHCSFPWVLMHTRY